MVEGLFTLSMADAGQLCLESEPVYINELLEEVCALVTSRGAKEGNCHPSAPSTRNFRTTGDEAFLHQLFSDFPWTNAIKYSPEKSVLHVSLEEVDGMIRVRFSGSRHRHRREAFAIQFFERFFTGQAPSNGGDSHSGRAGTSYRPGHRAPRTWRPRSNAQVKWAPASSFTVVLPLVPIGKSDTPGTI